MSCLHDDIANSWRKDTNYGVIFGILLHFSYNRKHSTIFATHAENEEINTAMAISAKHARKRESGPNIRSLIPEENGETS